ncbi:MAG: CapA family protein [Promethearchaeota archaeon]|jgi:hypothetical protein
MKNGEKKEPLIDIKTPYGFKENVLWLLRRLASRIDHDNEANIRYIPKRFVLDETIEKELTIIFSGDWLDLRGKDIKLGKKLKTYIRKSDYFILNLEKLITTENNWRMEKLHKPNIIEAIAELFTPENTVLSLANNHAGDCGDEKLDETIKMIEEQGFNIIGLINKPYIDLFDDFRMVGATRWSNLECDHILPFDSATSYLKDNSFNLLFPHWGYEFELFPRSEDVELARDYVEKFDAIIGHHSHCPQPINFENFQDKEKLIAYSLGTFCANRKPLSYKYGLLLKVHFGRDSMNQWKIKKTKWAVTKCSRFAHRKCRVEMTRKLPFFKQKSEVFLS